MRMQSTIVRDVPGESDRTRRVLQVTTDISVGGTQAIGGSANLDLGLLDEIMNEAQIESPTQF